MRPVPDQLAEQITVDHVSECWLWTGWRRNGYGITRLESRNLLYLHRVMYELLRGPIPAGMQIDHLCRIRLCCNPEHLEVVTPRENFLRQPRNGTHTHCVHGHELTPENLKIRPDGRRLCRACHRATQMRYRERRRHRDSS